MLRVVTHVHTRDEDVKRTAHGRHGSPCSGNDTRSVFVDPEYAQVSQLLMGERVGGTGIAPIHIPGIFGEYRAHVGSFDLLLEHVAVKILKAGFYVNRQIHAGWEFYRAIIGGLDASFLRRSEER